MASPKKPSSGQRAKALLPRSGMGVLLLVLAIGWLARSNGSRDGALEESIEPVSSTASRNSVASGGDLAIQQAFDSRRSDLVVEASGTVSRLLADDEEGSRHQRFVVELPSGHTILISHNLDLAPRVPLSRGDQIDFRGEYEWNERGGVVHWTHHDPRGRREGGWIRHMKKLYR